MRVFMYEEISLESGDKQVLEKIKQYSSNIYNFVERGVAISRHSRKKAERYNALVRSDELTTVDSFKKPIFMKTLATVNWKSHDELIARLNEFIVFFKNIPVVRVDDKSIKDLDEELFSSTLNWTKREGKTVLILFGGMVVKQSDYEFVTTSPNKKLKLYKPWTEDEILQLSEVLEELSDKYRNVSRTLEYISKYISGLDETKESIIKVNRLSKISRTLKNLLSIKDKVCKELINSIELSIDKEK